ncbi:MAG: DUF4350 domain-containing protein [Myxococcota bacterium]
MVDARRKPEKALKIACLLGGIAVTATGVGRAQDYRPQGDDWNGLQQLVAIAEDAGVSLDTLPSIDVAELKPTDSLLILYPQEALPKGSLSQFLRAGGRIAVADDFGEGGAFLQSYGIRRRAPTLTDDVPLLRGNPALPLAHPRARHPLMDGVQALVANHPQVLEHSDLDPVASFDESSSALVLAGAVEQGRLIAIGDPSLLINNMLRFQGNRRFAENLFRYLDAGRGGRVLLVTPDVRLIGRLGDGRGNPIRRIDDWLRDFAHAETPPLALLLSAIVLVSILMVFAVSTLPLRSPYSSGALQPGRASGGGFAGRVAFFRERPRDLVHPLMVYKFELEGELVQRLALAGRPVLRDVVGHARARGLSESDVSALRALLLELDELRRRLDLPPAPPKVSPRDLHRMVDTGERILAALDRLPPP